MTVDCITLAGIVAVIAFLWNLRRDVRALDRRITGIIVRVSKLEGLMEGLRDAITRRTGKLMTGDSLPFALNKAKSAQAGATN